MKEFVQEKSLRSHLLPAVIILGLTFFIIHHYCSGAAAWVRYLVGFFGIMAVFVYDKYLVVNTTLRFLITDKKVATFNRNGRYMYGMNWEDVKLKKIEKKGRTINRISLFSDRPLDFGTHPVSSAKVVQDINWVGLPANVNNPDEFLELIHKYTRDIPEELHKPVNRLPKD